MTADTPLSDAELATFIRLAVKAAKAGEPAAFRAYIDGETVLVSVELLPAGTQA